jgi:hypothetical protein
MLNISVDAEFILSGSRTTTGTILTVPAGMQWNGSVCLTASVAALGTGAPTVTTAGTDVAPAAGTVVHRLSVSGLALTTAGDSATQEVIVRAPEGNAVTLEFTAGATGTSTVTANGYLTN